MGISHLCPYENMGPKRESLHFHPKAEISAGNHLYSHHNYHQGQDHTLQISKPLECKWFSGLLSRLPSWRIRIIIPLPKHVDCATKKQP